MLGQIRTMLSMQNIFILLSLLWQSTVFNCVKLTEATHNNIYNCSCFCTIIQIIMYCCELLDLYKQNTSLLMYLNILNVCGECFAN